MEQQNEQASRKKFLKWSLGMISVFAGAGFLFRKTPKPAQTVKMLTEDGKLVEIDVSNIPTQKQKLKAGQIHTWITKRKSSL
mgnify:CR=1 FL=1